ncbi:MAG: hypothetical protein Ct9H90mP5_03620 [Acidimicrobiaceae bacterium]|nr:MAG: hypothetical protein Ct9H90mP5_03620 [Acidimicrobiaceae bacterium]
MAAAMALGAQGVWWGVGMAHYRRSRNHPVFKGKDATSNIPRHNTLQIKNG